MTDKKRSFIPYHYQNVLFCLMIFFSMQVFFVVLHPIVIMDLDDVLYTVFSRPAIPIPGFWNPSRVFPEVLMPLCGNLAGLFTAFGFGSFIHCQVFIFGSVLSLFITAYVNMLRKFLENRFSASFFTSSCLAVLFLMFHFVVFRTEASGNLYMFHTYDACCLFFYTIPALLCCTLVLFFMSDSQKDQHLGNGLFHNALFVTVLYFAVFSNLYGSIILAIYAALRLFRNTLSSVKGKLGLSAWFNKNWLWIAIVFFWLISLLLEALGGRASSMIQSDHSFLDKLSSAWTWFLFPIKKMSLFFRLLLIIIPVFTLLGLLIKPELTLNRSFLLAFCYELVTSVLCFIFLLLLATVSSSVYAGRVEAAFPFFFSIFFMLILCIHFILLRIPKASILLPIALIVVYTMINTELLTFADSNPLELDGSLALSIQNEIYENIRVAAEQGAEEVTVSVPMSEDYPTNWPHNQWVGDPVAEFLLKYGVINHHIKVIIQPSMEYNQSHHIQLEGKVLR